MGAKFDWTSPCTPPMQRRKKLLCPPPTPKKQRPEHYYKHDGKVIPFVCESGTTVTNAIDMEECLQKLDCAECENAVNMVLN